MSELNGNHQKHYGSYLEGYKGTHPNLLARDIRKPEHWRDPRFQEGILKRLDEALDFTKRAVEPGPAQDLFMKALPCGPVTPFLTAPLFHGTLFRIREYVATGVLQDIWQWEIEDLSKLLNRLGELANEQARKCREAV